MLINLIRVSLGVFLAMASWNASADLALRELLCEHLTDPCGLDAPQPRLTWKLGADHRAEFQTAYQVLVADSLVALSSNNGDLWDSGKVASDETTGVVYRGKGLRSRQQCFWKARVWDRSGTPSAWSKPAHWEMGLLEPADWKAKWIARTTDINVEAAPLLRREFNLGDGIKQARAYICGLGYYEFYLNGKRVGNHLLDPGYTRYDKRDLYTTYDVTGLLESGRNAIGVILGNGWYNVQNKTAWDFDKAPWRAAPKLLLQVEVEFEDGRRVVIASDQNWKCSASATVFNTVYSGETYDARLEQPGWSRPGFDDSKWKRVLTVRSPGGILVAQTMPPIEADQTFTPERITQPEPGRFVFDFGQNMAGHVRLTASGPAGAAIKMKYGERLLPNGLVDQKDIAEHVVRFDSNQLFQTDTYILKGRGVETWESQFSYKGFQYVEVTGFPGEPDAGSLLAIATHSAVPASGQFDCSNPLLNWIWGATRWSYLNNLQGLPTDCPQREKNGWTGDAHLAAEQGMYNYFAPSIYSKWINDIADAQRTDGTLPGIVPSGGWGYDGKGAAWDSAFLLIPYYEYVYYGDDRDLRRHYAGMKSYVDYLTRKSRNCIPLGHSLGDWLPWKTKTRADLLETGYYYADAKIVALAACLLGREEEASEYLRLAETIRAAFNQKFFNRETGLYDNGSQTALACALYQGLVEPGDRARVLGNLITAIDRNGDHIDTGILGAKYVLNALLENGRADAAYRVVNQTTQPGWGWWRTQGATTLWESWGDGGSHDHVMFGDVCAWLYKALAGIRPDPHAPGFKHFFIHPNLPGGLAFARADYDSIRGQIASEWKLQNGECVLSVLVPPNTTATVTLPVTEARFAREGGAPLSEAAGIGHVRVESGRVTFEAAGGHYEFVCEIAKSRSKLASLPLSPK